MQDILILLHGTKNIIDQLKYIYKRCDFNNQDFVLQLLQDQPILTDADRLEITANERIIIQKCFKARIYDIANVCHQENFTLQVGL